MAKDRNWSHSTVEEPQYSCKAFTKNEKEEVTTGDTSYLFTVVMKNKVIMKPYRTKASTAKRSV